MPWFVYLFLSVFMAVGLWFIGKGISEAVIAHQSVGWQSTRGRITDSKIVASRGRKGGNSYKPQIATRAIRVIKDSEFKKPPHRVRNTAS
jgi:hypothetical protein